MKGFVIGSLLICVFQWTFSQNASIHTQYRIQKLTVEDGLSHGRVNAIVRDKDGFMWFATNVGINRYDGFTFKLYEHIAGDSLSINHDMVRDVICDQRGAIWVSSDAGINLYNVEKDVFIKTKTDNEESLGIVWDLFEGKDGLIWAGSRNGLYYAKPPSQEFKDFSIDNPWIKGNDIKRLYEDENNNLWIGTRLNGLFVFNRKLNSYKHFIPVPGDPSSISERNIESVFEDSKGNIWVGTSDAGINKYNKKDDTFTRITVDNNDPLSDKVREVIEDEQGRLWLGTKAGLYCKMEGEKDEFYRYAHEDHGYSILTQNSIYDIYLDDVGIMWIGTYLGGVNYIDFNQKRFVHYYAKQNDNRFLNNGIVFSIFEDSRSNLWIGTDNGGINYLDRKTDVFKYYMHDPLNPNSLSSNNIKCIMEDRHGDFWIGTYEGGLNYYKPGSNIFTHYKNDPDNPKSIVNNNINVIMIDSKLRMWLGTPDGPNVKYEGSEEFIRFNKDGTGENRLLAYVMAIYEDSDHKIWIGTVANSLLYYNESDNRFYTFKEDVIKKAIYTICEDDLHRLWVGGDLGVFCIDRKNDTIYNYTKNDGLPSNKVFRVIDDTLGNIWISSAKGLTKFTNGVFRPDTANFKNFNKADGLQSSIFIRNTYIKGNTGELFFGGTNGFNTFYPNEIVNNPYKPNVIITGLKVFNKEIKIGQEIEGKVVLPKSISTIEELELSYKHKVFTFEFAALHFVQPKLNKYKYKLEGFDKEWNETTAERRYATYTNLPGKEYVFKVKASNNDGLWNEEPAILKVRITPPFWKTLWFRIVFVIVILGLIASYFLLRIYNLQKQRKELEDRVNERTKDLKEANIQLKQQARDLNNTNTLLEERQMRIEEQAEELEAQKNELEERQDKILEQSNQLEAANDHLIELNSTKDKFFSIIAHDLKTPFQTIMGFAELLKFRYPKLNEEKKLKYIDLLFVASNNLYKLLENLLSWARTQTNRITFERINIAMDDLIENNIGLLNESLKRKQIQISVKYDKQCEALVDKDMMNAVIRNLLTNAIKFTENKGRIEVKCKKVKSQLEISINDNGIGMTASDMNKLFRIDKSFSKSGTDGERGTGLGLILCKEFIHKHGGKIWVESEIQKGSTFTFTIPAAR